MTRSISERLVTGPAPLLPPLGAGMGGPAPDLAGGGGAPAVLLLLPPPPLLVYVVMFRATEKSIR